MAARGIVFALLVLLPFHAVLKLYLTNEFLGTYWKEGLVLTLGLVVSFSAVIGHRRHRFLRRLRRSGVLVPLALYFGIVLLRFLLSPDFMLGLWGLYFYGTYFVVFVAVVYYFDRAQLESVFLVLSMLGGGLGVLLVLDFLIDLSAFQSLDEYHADWFMGDMGFRRARFPFASPLVATAFLSVTAAITYQALLRPLWRPRNRAALAVFLALNLLGLAATFSRGGWVAFVIGVSVITLLQAYPHARLPGPGALVLPGLMAVGAGGLVLVSGSAEAIIARAGSIFETSELGNIDRLAAWAVSINAFLNAPVFGIGIGTTGARVLAVSENAFITESYILQHMVEMGVLGLGVYLLLFSTIVRLGLRHLRRLGADSTLRFQVVAATSVLVSLFVYSAYLQVLQMREISMLFWVLSAVLVVASDEAPELKYMR